MPKLVVVKHISEGGVTLSPGDHEVQRNPDGSISLKDGRILKKDVIDRLRTRGDIKDESAPPEGESAT